MRRLAIAAVAFALAACDAPTIPEREAFYDFALADPPLVFHWPAGSDVRLHVAGGTDTGRAAALRAAAAHAARAWNDVALFGEFELALTANAPDADVILRWSNVESPVVSPDPVRCAPVGGRAVTTFCPDAAGKRLLVFPQREGGGRTRFVITISATVLDDGELHELVTHEVGHALGLWNHPSPVTYPESVMLPLPTTDVPTAIDRATVQVLYHTRPDVGL